MRMLRYIIITLLSLMPSLGLLYGATKPKVSSGLSHVNVAVNGEKTAVQAGQVLNVYRGDNIVFIQAESRETGVKPSLLAIDVEGFHSAPGSGPEAEFDDRGVDINTALLPGNVFKVTVRSGGRPIGQIKLVVAEPRFDYAVMLVNGSPMTVRPGGKLKLQATDQIKLDSVRSNISDPSKIEVEASGGGALRFKYRGRVFGEIRLPLQGAGVQVP